MIQTVEKSASRSLHFHSSAIHLACDNIFYVNLKDLQMHLITFTDTFVSRLAHRPILSLVLGTQSCLKTDDLRVLETSVTRFYCVKILEGFGLSIESVASLRRHAGTWPTI